MQPTIETRIKHWLGEQILFTDGAFPAEDDDSFLDNGLIDSLGVMELVMHLKTDYGIDIAPLEVTPENFDSVNRVAAFVRRKQALSATNGAPVLVASQLRPRS